jgi:flap endonuclease-1
MGVNLRDIASPQPVDMDDMRGRVIAIDALNMIYQFLSTIRDRFTGEPLKDSSGNVTSHLSGLFYRTSRMMEAGITPVFIFDGEPPEFKKGTQDARRKIREDAREKWQQALREGDTEKVRLYSQQAMKVTDDMLSEGRKLLSCMGVQCVLAPSEGEAQASCMNRDGAVYACGSQDWDCLMFGAKRLVRNLGVTGRRKLPGKETYVKVSPEMVDLEDMLSRVSITREQLVMIGILVGTDYNPGGVKGIGPKRALDLVREKTTLEAVMSGHEWDFDVSYEKIFRFFMEPPCADVDIKSVEPDFEKLKELLASHDFSEERTGKTLERISQEKEKKKQSSLQKFF